jgi:formylglycine-generating enzyme required for sulfatase activity
MKKRLLSIALLAATFIFGTTAVNAQTTKVYVHQKDGSAVGFNIADVDRINFTAPPIPDVLDIEMVSVAGGKFQMGSPESSSVANEKPEHEVTLTGFKIGKYEVTQGQWEEVMGENPSANKGGDDFPVENVSWNDIVGTEVAGATNDFMELNGIKYYENGFIYKLNKLTNMQYRLPTEAEWEYAARGGDKSTEDFSYSGSNTIDDVAWYITNAN